MDLELKWRVTTNPHDYFDLDCNGYVCSGATEFHLYLDNLPNHVQYAYIRHVDGKACSVQLAIGYEHNNLNINIGAFSDTLAEAEDLVRTWILRTAL